MSKLKAFLGLIALMLFLFFGKVSPEGHRYIEEVFDFGHVLLFGVVSLAILSIISKSTNKRPTLFACFFAGFFTLILGFATECVQSLLPGRELSSRDLLFDLIGASVFLGNRFVYSREKVSRIFSTAILLISILLLGFCFKPTVTAYLDEQEMKKNFPMIGSFEGNYELDRWKEVDSRISVSGKFKTHGNRSMLVKLKPAKYPGVSTLYCIRNWTGYDMLTFDISLEGDEPLKILVRINDGEHRSVYEDRYNKSFDINPKLNKISIPLKDVMNAPKGRKMNMSNISHIVIFTSKLKKKRTFFIDNIQLSK